MRTIIALHRLKAMAPVSLISGSGLAIRFRPVETGAATQVQTSDDP